MLRLWQTGTYGTGAAALRNFNTHQHYDQADLTSAENMDILAAAALTSTASTIGISMHLLRTPAESEQTALYNLMKGIPYCNGETASSA